MRYLTLDDSGRTRKERNEQFNRGELTPDEPEIPDQVLHLVDWFEALSTTRRFGEAGPMSIAPSDVLAWTRLTGVYISPAEYAILADMDVAYMNAAGEFREEQRAKYEKTNKIEGRK